MSCGTADATLVKVDDPVTTADCDVPSEDRTDALGDFPRYDMVCATDPFEDFDDDDFDDEFDDDFEEEWDEELPGDADQFEPDDKEEDDDLTVEPEFDEEE